MTFTLSRKSERHISRLTLRSLASEPIAVIVGTGGFRKTWHLPKELLTNSSPFFDAALKTGCFAEAKSKVVNLPEDDVDAFALYIRWLYVGEIGTDYCIVDHNHCDDQYCCEAAVETLIQAWVLGDKLGCAIFKDLVMLGLIRTLNLEFIHPNNVRTAYERSAPGSKLRKLFLDQLRYDVWRDSLGNNVTDWVTLTKDCGDFGEELMRAFLHREYENVEDPCRQKGLYLEVLKATAT